MLKFGMHLNIALATFLITVSVFAAENETVSLSRYITLKSCYKDQKECVGPVAKQIETANVKIELKPFQKGKASGLEGWNRSLVIEDGIFFNGEVHLIKHAKPGKYKYYLYMRVRSGARKGAVKTIDLKELADLKDVVLTDRPIKFERGTLQAQLVLGQKMNIEEPKK